MSKKIRIVNVPVGEGPKVEEIDAGLEAMQALVGGYIEFVAMGGNVALVCNEEGMMLGLPQNGCGILGPYFFTKTDPGTGDSASLTDAECDAIRAHVVAHRQVRHRGAHIELTSYGSIEEMIADRERRKFDEDHAN